MNADYGHEQHATSVGQNATWVGVAGYLRLNPLPDFSLCIRLEQFEDREGVRTGLAQKLREFTFTPEYRPGPHFVVRGDVRVDNSDHEVFMKRRDFVDRQATVNINAIYLY